MWDWIEFESRSLLLLMVLDLCLIVFVIGVDLLLILIFELGILTENYLYKSSTNELPKIDANILLIILADTHFY